MATLMRYVLHSLHTRPLLTVRLSNELSRVTFEIECLVYSGKLHKPREAIEIIVVPTNIIVFNLLNRSNRILIK